jgi:PAS domain S-box-containing protein
MARPKVLLTQDYFSFRRRLLAGVAAFGIFAFGFITWKIYSSYVAYQEMKQMQMQSFLPAMEAYVTRTIELADISLNSYANSIKELNAEKRDSTAALRQLLRFNSAHPEAGFKILFLDAKGIGVATSDEKNIHGTSYADRDYFIANTHPNHSLFVSEPVIGKVSQLRMFAISRRVESASGKFLGVVAAQIDPIYMVAMFNSARFDHDVSVTLAHTSGKIIAQSPFFDQWFGRSIVQAPLFQHFKVAPQGTYQAVSVIDNEPRIYSYRQIDKFPLVIAVGISSNIWNSSLRNDILLASVSLFLIAMFMLTSTRFTLASYTLLKKSETRYRQLYTSIRDGIVLVRTDGTVEECNDAFLHIIGKSREEICNIDFRKWAPNQWRDINNTFDPKKLLDHEEPEIYEFQYTQSNGGTIYLSITLWLIHNDFNVPIMVGALVRNISEHKLAQKALSRSHDLLELAVKERTAELKNTNRLLVNEVLERNRSEEAVRQSQETLRRLVAHQEKIKEEERRRIAREIHDELGSLLTVIKAHVSIAIERAQHDSASSKQLLSDACDYSDKAIETVRKIITDLRPSVLDELGIWAALQWYASQVEGRTGIQCKCLIEDAVINISIDSERSTMLFRIVQEALTNVIRHAHATRIVVQAHRDEHDIVIQIQDNGVGIPTEDLLSDKSWGIRGMYERASHFNVDLKIAGSQGQGTTIQLRMILEHATE